MKYKNAKDILPDKLLRELQEYISGGVLYVPHSGDKKQWGENSGARQYYKQRNLEIRGAYQSGEQIDHLAFKYQLSEEAIRKILFAGQQAIDNSAPDEALQRR